MRVYDVITEKITGLLKGGVIPWRKPWSGASWSPRNLLSQKPYRGINALLLGAMPHASPYWLTYKQAEQLGGHVRHGEHACPIIYWNWIERLDSNDETLSLDSFPVLRYYSVFNLKQCDLPSAALPTPPELTQCCFQPLDRCEQVVRLMPNPPTITHDGGDRAYYHPVADGVHVPQPGQFHCAAGYYATLFHELTHSTGHPRRLPRPGVMQRSAYGGEEYTKEELIAEMGAAFLCGHCGIESATLANQASYIAGWLQALSDDRRLVVYAAASAQKAADYILGQTREMGQQNVAIAA